MRQRMRQVAVMTALAVVASGCFGPFNLTRRVYRWNDTVSDDKWVKEGAFLLTGAFLPFYTFAVLGDAVVFNSVEFWGKKNPVNPPEPSQKRR